jgi:hypothetical protein
MYGKRGGRIFGAFTPDNENAEVIQFLNTQIDWNSLYQPKNPVIDSNGNIMGYEAAKSHYVLYEDRTDDQTVVASSNFSTQLNENLIMNAGGSLRNLKSLPTPFLGPAGRSLF